MIWKKRGILHALHAVVAIAAIGQVSIGYAQQPRERPFSVKDDISFTQIISMDASIENAPVQWSPDRRHFFAVAANGDLATNSNVYRLWCYSVTTGPALVVSKPKLLLQVSSKTNMPGIVSARWLGNSQISLLRSAGLGPAQLYLVDLDGNARAVTQHRTSLSDYGISRNAKDALIQAEQSPASIDEVSRGYIGGREAIERLYGVGMRFPLYTEKAYFHVDLATGEERPLHTSTLMSNNQGFGNSQITVSPDGRWAVVAVSNSDSSSGTPYTSPEYFYPRYLLLDIRDAIRGSANGTNLDLNGDEKRGVVHISFAWAPNSGGLYISRKWSSDGTQKGTFKNGHEDIEFVELPSKTKEIVADLGQATDDTAQPDTRIRSTGADFIEVERFGGRAPAEALRYRRHGVGWKLETEVPATQEVFPLKISVHQGLNLPPDLFARWGSGKEEQISNLNPQLLGSALNPAEEIEWRGLNGKKWKGALLKPDHYQAGRRYGLVIQTHGYHAGVFLINGVEPWMTSGYAMRALAARGLIVLDTPDDHSDQGTPAEIPDNISVIAGAVRQLVDAGLVDKNRIGIHGASRSGYWVQGVLFSRTLAPAAASIAEADEVSRDNYIASFGCAGVCSMSNVERMWNLPPLFGVVSAAAWARSDPTNHMDRMKTPLLLEAYQAHVGEWWEDYALLRRNSRPAEYIYFPDAAHVPVKPVERLVAQGSVVDWYDFWLNGHEDPDPGKREQYGRWEKLCDLQIAENTGHQAFCIPTKHRHGD